jgi:hypothetical protein
MRSREYYFNFSGIAILNGLTCAMHLDTRDTGDGWVADMAFGDFQGGLLQVPQTGFQFPLSPNDVILMRSAILWHGVSPVTSGKRYGMVLFTHSAMQDEDEPTEPRDSTKEESPDPLSF